MKQVSLIQGSPEWHQHRASHRNASDAPAMLGVSPYKTRAQLLRELATGLTPDVDDATQRRFDDGHRFEALARPLAERIVGEDLFPCVGVEGRYSASFDGLSLMEDLAFEHKSLNADLRSLMDRADFTGADLPEHYRVQMEQQCMVSGATRVLFMATRWDGDSLAEQLWCWYTPDPTLRARIVAGWARFEHDLANYQPEPAPAPALIGNAPDRLPALRIELTGAVTASNLAEFRDHAIAVFKGISTDLQTDQDFADAERTVKWCGDIEDRLAAAKDHALSQTRSIDELFRAIDSIRDEARAKRLELDKLVKARKEAVRAEILARARESVQAHYAAINTTLGEHHIQPPSSLVFDLGNAIKGKKTVASVTDAAEAAVATAKIDASQRAERIRQCIAVLADFAEHSRLFADRVQLCATKAPEDLRNLAAARIAEHKRLDEERERERQRLEEQRVREAEERGRQMAEIAAQRAKEQQSAAGAPEAQKPLHESANNAGVATGSRNDSASESVTLGSLPSTIPSASSARIKLGDINAAIAPLSITCDGLMQLGIQPVAIDRAAKLYAVDDLPRIYSALRAVIRNAEAALTLPAKAA